MELLTFGSLTLTPGTPAAMPDEVIAALKKGLSQLTIRILPGATGTVYFVNDDSAADTTDWTNVYDVLDGGPGDAREFSSPGLGVNPIDFAGQIKFDVETDKAAKLLFSGVRA